MSYLSILCPEKVGGLGGLLLLQMQEKHGESAAWLPVIACIDPPTPINTYMLYGGWSKLYTGWIIQPQNQTFLPEFVLPLWDDGFSPSYSIWETGWDKRSGYNYTKLELSNGGHWKAPRTPKGLSADAFGGIGEYGWEDLSELHKTVFIIIRIHRHKNRDLDTPATSTLCSEQQ